MELKEPLAVGVIWRLISEGTESEREEAETSSGTTKRLAQKIAVRNATLLAVCRSTFVQFILMIIMGILGKCKCFFGYLGRSFYHYNGKKFCRGLCFGGDSSKMLG